MEVGDGEGALRHLAAMHFDAVLLDEHLPDKNGLEVLAAARQNGCEAAVVVLTGDKSASLSERAIQAGADGFLTKPFDPRELLARVQHCVSRRRVLESDPVVSYIREHFARISSREEVAHALGLSRRTVSRRVAKITGESFGEFLCRCRIEGARELLRTTELSVGEIADRMGFCSQESFAQVFRRKVHVSPREHRLLVRGKLITRSIDR